jgi:hypothetical protein
MSFIQISWADNFIIVFKETPLFPTTRYAPKPDLLKNFMYCSQSESVRFAFG